MSYTTKRTKENEIIDFALYCMDEDRDFQSFWETLHSDEPNMTKDEAKRLWEFAKEKFYDR